jgi:hypothetical protein
MMYLPPHVVVFCKRIILFLDDALADYFDLWI